MAVTFYPVADCRVGDGVHVSDVDARLLLSFIRLEPYVRLEPGDDLCGECKIDWFTEQCLRWTRANLWNPTEIPAMCDGNVTDCGVRTEYVIDKLHALTGMAFDALKNRGATIIRWRPRDKAEIYVPTTDELQSMLSDYKSMSDHYLSLAYDLVSLARWEAEKEMRWCRRDPAYQERVAMKKLIAKYARAREIGFTHLAEEILEISDNSSRDLTERETSQGTVLAVDHDHIARARLRVDTRKWLLSKMLPKLYGDRTEVTGRGGAPLEIRFIPGDENL